MIKKHFKAVALGTLVANSVPAAAFTVTINDLVYEVTDRPEVRVAQNSNGLYIVIPGINLGNGQTQTNTAASTNTNSTNTSTNTTNTNSTNTSTNTTDTSTTTSNTSSGSCVASARVSCWQDDYGPLGNENNSKIKIPDGSVLAIPFTVGSPSGLAYGQIQFAWIEGQEVENDAEFYVWYSAEPGGKPLSTTCSGKRGVNDAVNWIQTRDYGGYCRLPDVKTTVYVNAAFCAASAGDMTCANPKAWGGTIRLSASSRKTGY